MSMIELTDDELDQVSGGNHGDPGDPGCGGRIVAANNHASGGSGPSGNPKASTGPGYFLKGDTPEAIAGAREANCTVH
jgi:bacteriocin-like protein